MSPDAGGRPLRVGVNLLWLVPGVVGGSEEYTTRLLRGLAVDPPADLHVTLFVLEPFIASHPDLAASFPTVSLTLDGRMRPLRVAAESTWLPTQARRRRIDLLHHAGGVIPPGPAVRSHPAVLTIHDLQPLVRPENFSRLKRTWLGALLPRSARRARMVATPSDHVGQQVVELLHVPAGRVATVPHGIEPPRPTSPEVQASVRRRLGIGDRFVLYPAMTYPHKDHETLLRAFARIATDRPDVDLVLTGAPAQEEERLRRLTGELGLTARVHRTGRIPRADLDALFDSASVLACPSRFEGFGAPVLEAFGHGCPVVAARSTSLPEVVGDAGLLVPPG
ncbi:MAG: glycosyl transferase, group 1, partial [Acidimicrobiales bacterium]|nr:glycosyl transferase, group 1 [Acidimicrobiales bacterium]